jgi:hypothetical protein
MVGRMSRDLGKGPKKISFDVTRNAKKDIMGAINVNV